MPINLSSIDGNQNSKYTSPRCCVGGGCGCGSDAVANNLVATVYQKLRYVINIV